MAILLPSWPILGATLRILAPALLDFFGNSSLHRAKVEKIVPRAPPDLHFLYFWSLRTTIFIPFRVAFSWFSFQLSILNTGSTTVRTQVVLHQTTSCDIILIITQHIHITSYDITYTPQSHHIVSYHITSHHIIPVMSCHSTWFHIISYHVISCHDVSIMHHRFPESPFQTFIFSPFGVSGRRFSSLSALCFLAFRRCCPSPVPATILLSHTFRTSSLRVFPHTAGHQIVLRRLLREACSIRRSTSSATAPCQDNHVKF